MSTFFFINWSKFQNISNQIIERDKNILFYNNEEENVKTYDLNYFNKNLPL